MATKRTFAVEATAAARNLDLLRTQISRLQLGLALPQYQRVEFLTLAMLLASALELRAPAVGSGFRIALRFFLKASAFFPVSASLFLCGRFRRFFLLRRGLFLLRFFLGG